MPAPFWNPKRDERLRKLREAGKENKVIARKMGVHESSVARRAAELKLPKRGNLSKFWNAERDAQLKELWAKVPTLSMSAISHQLGGEVSKAYVSARAKKLGLTSRYKSAAGLTGEAAETPDAPHKRKVYQSRDTRLFGVPDDVDVTGMSEHRLNKLVTENLKKKRSGPAITYPKLTGCVFYNPLVSPTRCGAACEGQYCDEHRRIVSGIAARALTGLNYGAEHAVNASDISTRRFR